MLNTLKKIWNRIQSLFRRKKPYQAPPPPREGRLLARVCQQRAYRLYVPSSYHLADPRPLIVMLHGCTQDPEDFMTGTEMNRYAEQHACLAVYPEQPASANRKKCWNWFRPDNQARGMGEPAEIVAIVEQVRNDFAIDARRIYVAGLSAGGCLAATLGITYPDVFTAVGICAGIAHKSARTALGAYAAMRGNWPRWLVASPTTRLLRRTSRVMPLIVFHGAADKVVAPINSERLIAQWAHVHGLPITNRTVERRERPDPDSLSAMVYTYHDSVGRAVLQRYCVDGMGHAWPGGSANGSFTEPRGPKASALMLEFFLSRRIQTAAMAQSTAIG